MRQTGWSYTSVRRRWRGAVSARPLMLALIAGALLWATSCAAQTTPQQMVPQSECDSIIKIAKHLDVKYGEVPVAFGVQNDGRLMEIYTSEASGTWTVIVISPDGIGCVVAAGKGWEILPPGDRT